MIFKCVTGPLLWLSLPVLLAAAEPSSAPPSSEVVATSAPPTRTGW